MIGWLWPGENVNMKDEDFVKYYVALKQLRKLHVEFGFGKHPPVPSGFPEGLCKHLFELDEWQGRKFDASIDGQGIEIKATGDDHGKTTINLQTIINAGAEFGGIRWVYFVFERQISHCSY
jgi:hypothetical protein